MSLPAIPRLTALALTSPTAIATAAELDEFQHAMPPF